jgi:hypothetical protein
LNIGHIRVVSDQTSRFTIGSIVALDIDRDQRTWPQIVATLNFNCGVCRQVASSTRSATMENGTFRKWLVEQGCRFDHGPEQRHEGHVVVTVHHDGRKAEVPLGGSHQILNTRVVRQACDELGLDSSQLPGPKSRV